jgi:sarcosine oxidase subunit gamma
MDRIEDLAPRSAFATLPRDISAGDGVIFRDRDGIGLAMIIARRGGERALSEAVRAAFGIDPPQGPRRAGGPDIAMAGVGPGVWLASRERDDGFAIWLREKLGEAASISDQSSGLAIVRVSGPKARAVLAKGIPVDLHERSFKIDDVAATVCAHMNVTIWRLADAPDLSPVYELAVFRSCAGSFWRWLARSAAEFGLAVKN